VEIESLGEGKKLSWGNTTSEQIWREPKRQGSSLLMHRKSRGEDSKKVTAGKGFWKRKKSRLRGKTRGETATIQNQGMLATKKEKKDKWEAGKTQVPLDMKEQGRVLREKVEVRGKSGTACFPAKKNPERPIIGFF